MQMGEVCWIKTGLGEPADNSVLVGIRGLMEDTEHHLRKAQGYGRVKDRQGIGEDLRALGQIPFLCLGVSGCWTLLKLW